MLYTKLIHPGLLRALAAAGHGSQILIADGNYPLTTCTGVNAELVYLNLTPGQIPVTDILQAVLSAIPVEAAHVMEPGDGSEPAIFAEFRKLLPGRELQGVGRFEFYEMTRKPDVAVAIASGDQRLFANILLTVGVVPPA